MRSAIFTAALATADSSCMFATATATATAAAAATTTAATALPPRLPLRLLPLALAVPPHPQQRRHHLDPSAGWALPPPHPLPRVRPPPTHLLLAATPRRFHLHTSPAQQITSSPSPSSSFPSSPSASSPSPSSSFPSSFPSSSPSSSFPSSSPCSYSSNANSHETIRGGVESGDGGGSGGGGGDPAAAAAAAEVQVPLVPGTYFRVAAGRAAVRVEHVAGWSDVATLRGRPAGGGCWAAAAASVDTAVGSSSLAGVRQVYDVRQETSSPGGGLADNGVMGGSGGAVVHGAAAVHGGGGLLLLAVPEKWISLDIRTSGFPVSVSKVVEADLRVVTGGAPVTLGSVRALRVELDTSLYDGGGGAPLTLGSVRALRVELDTSLYDGGGGADSGGGGGHATSGSVTGGDVSGTSISITAGGAVRVRRLVGGSMRLATRRAAPCTATRRTAASTGDGGPGIYLGAVYGGRLHLRTDGSEVRVGTLDCGAAAAAAAAAGGDGGGAVLIGAGGGGGGSRPTGDDGAAGSLTDSGDSQPRHPVAAAGAAAGEDLPYSGAEILSYGGAVTLDGLEGDAVVDSAGGAIKVLIQPGLRSARLASGGGSVEVALAPGTALRRVEVVGAAEVLVHPDLQRHLEPLTAEAPGGGGDEGGGGGEGDEGGDTDPALKGDCNRAGMVISTRTSTAAGVWVAKLASEVEAGGRGAGRGRGGGGDAQAASGGGGGGGLLVVEAVGGVVSLRRLGWMEAVRARMEEKGKERER